MSVEIETEMGSAITISPYSIDPGRYIGLWQDEDLVLVYRDQVDELIEQLQKLKESA